MFQLKDNVRAAISASALISALIAPWSVAHADIVTDVGARAVTWLTAKQEADGGFGSGFSKGSDLGATADAVMALAAAKQDIYAIKSKSGKTPRDYLTSQVKSGRLKVGQYAKVALAVKAAGFDPRNFGGKNLVELVKAGYNDQTGVIGDSVFIHALATLALARAGEAIPAKAITTLESLQAPSGGWAFGGGNDVDVDTTALAVQALIAAGRPANTGAAGKALGYLRSVQNADGGFPYQAPSQFGTDTNANSTALVAQAIIAGGYQPEAWAATKGNPLSALIALQRPTGSIALQRSLPDDNVLATVGAIPALYRKAYGS